MGNETPDVRLPNGVLRGAVALFGVLALVVAASVLVAAVGFLSEEPQSAGEAHAMAHSVPGVLVAVVVWTGGGSLVGGVLLAVAYADRRLLSAVALVAAGSLGTFLLLQRGSDRLAAVGLVPVALGGYVLYEAARDSGPLAFLAEVTALLWIVHVLESVAISLRLPGPLLSPLLFTVGYLWMRWLLGVGALAVLVVALWYGRLDVSVPRAPVALAAAVLVVHLPDPVWTAFSERVVWGLGPLEWVRMLAGTGAAVGVLVAPLVRAVRRRR